MRILCLLLLILPAAFGFVHSPDCANDETPPPAPNQVDLTPWLRQLAAPRRADRLAAEQHLLDLGTGILDQLPDPGTLPTASAREAVRRVRIALETRRARESLRAGVVRWESSGTLKTAVEQLAAQTGNRLELDVAENLAAREFVSASEPLTFWAAVGRLEDQYGLAVRTGANGVMRFTSTPESSASLAQTESGPTRLRLVAAAMKSLPGNPNHDLLRLQWLLEIEPRLLPLFLKLRADDVDARDGEGQVFSPFTPGAVVELSLVGNREPVAVQSDLLISKGELPSELEVSLKFSLYLAAGREEFVFENPLDGTTRTLRRGGVNVSLLPSHAAEGTRRIPLRIVYDTGGPAFESHRNWFDRNPLALERDGRTLAPHAPPRVTLERNGGIGLEFEFPETETPPRPSRLVYTLPTLLTESTFAVERLKVKLSSTTSDRKTQGTP